MGKVAYCRAARLKVTFQDLNAINPTSLLRSVSIAAALLAGCSSQIDGGRMIGGSPDASAAEASADAAPPLISFDADLGPQDIHLQATASNVIEADNTVYCRVQVEGNPHSENHYYRTYSLPDLGISGDLIVTSVDVGIQEARTVGGTQPISVNLHTLQGEFLLANLTNLSTTAVTVSDQVLTLLPVPVEEVVVPADSILVVEVAMPSGEADGNLFLIGSNKGAEAQASFIVAPSTGCDIINPTAVSLLGIPDLLMAVVLNVNGRLAE